MPKSTQLAGGRRCQGSEGDLGRKDKWSGSGRSLEVEPTRKVLEEQNLTGVQDMGRLMG